MTQRRGGWVLELRCVTCETSARFRAVVLTLAAEQAHDAGWQVEADPSVLVRRPGEREEVCPQCVQALAG